MSRCGLFTCMHGGACIFVQFIYHGSRGSRSPPRHCRQGVTVRPGRRQGSESKLPSGQLQRRGATRDSAEPAQEIYRLPRQRFEFIGLEWDTKLMTRSLMHERVIKVQAYFKDIKISFEKGRKVSCRHKSRGTGQLISSVSPKRKGLKRGTKHGACPICRRGIRRSRCSTTRQK